MFSDELNYGTGASYYMFVKAKCCLSFLRFYFNLFPHFDYKYLYLILFFRAYVSCCLCLFNTLDDEIITIM